MRDSTKWRATGLIFCLIIFGVLMWAGCYFFDDMLGLVSKKDKIVFWLLSMLLFGLFLGLLTLGVWSHQKGLRFQGGQEDQMNQVFWHPAERKSKSKTL